MADTKTEKKTALLLLPLQLTQNKNILRSITVSKHVAGIKYDITDLGDMELRKYYHQLPNQAKQGLYQLTNEGLYKMEGEIIKRHKQQKSGVQLRDFLMPAYARKLQEQFEFFKPFAGLVKWYHQLPNTATGNMVIAPCIFSTYKPSLQFEVVKDGDGLLLKTVLNINGNNYSLDEFRRFNFLLESKNEYFLLANKDYQTLEWLAQNNPQQYSHDATLMAQHILSKLEDNYKVQRNNLFATTTIETLPRQRVLLSEISNSFLVLTPQWVYDGYIAEGEWKPFLETTNNGETIIVNRNKEIELAFKKQLEALHPNFVKQLNGWYYLSFAEAQKKQWFLKVYHQLLEMDIELVGIDMLTHFRYSAHKPVTEMKVLTKDATTLLVDFSLQFGEEKIPLAELQKMLIAGQRAVMLKDGSLGVLDEAWIDEYATIIKHSKVDKKQLNVPQWLAVSEQKNESNNQPLKITVNDNWWANWERWQQPDNILFPISPKIKATLRPYQQKGFEWLKMLAEINAGACLADDMGLGKTLQTICFITDRLEQVKEGIVIIVCPSSLIYNWQNEVAKFAPHLRTYIHHGQARDIANISAANMDICITSYGTMRGDIEQLAALHFDVAVIDESHNIKNPSAQSTRAIYQLQVRSRVALSGTPVMNNTFDLYSQLEFLLPGMFGSKEFFKREYADAIDRDRNEEKILALQKLTAPFILRRTKEQVAKDLPEKTESILWCNMGMAQKDMYDGIKESVKSNLFMNIKTEGLGKSKLAVLQGIMKLKQACNSPLLLPAEERSTHHSVKTEMLLEELANLGGHKVLVFSQFTKMLNLLAETFTQKGISFNQLDGSTPPKQRAALVANFQEPANTTNVFLISLMAGNTGLTLTAADYVFLFDPWWNNAVQQQAIDRTHRIGQTKNVFAYKMICKDTIEEKIIQLQQKKKELSDNLIGDNEGFVKQLSKEDVEFLFS
ncbi:MAG: DEAD/DEAH box helicase [Ferruginibacter sp.]|nr:DEAD/DEAH box helicase [Ferruginibacter sp.]